MRARFPSSPKAYRYDGSFDGFLCCVFESFLKKQTPAAILPQDGPYSLYPEKQIETDPERASRVWRSLPARISPSAADLTRCAFLTCMPEKELPLLRVLQEGFRKGGSIMNFLADEDLSSLVKAVRFLKNESHLLSGFVRFSEYGSVLVSVITPKNHVLPLLAQHFCSRMPDERFLIFDKTHREALLYRPGDLQFCPMDELSLPPPNRTEAEYRALWKRFYNTVAIEGRTNPRCRMSHMPKRYWENMTEFQESGEPAQTLPGHAAHPSISSVRF